MPAVSFDDDPIIDPDNVKMPERAAHRRTVDLIAQAAIELLGLDVHVFCDLNWYPDDDRPAVAPDVMVLPASASETLPRSYRQDQTGGPPPLVVVEILSDTDSYLSVRAKIDRYQRLGTVTYLVSVDGDYQGVERFGADDTDPVRWTDTPIPELGGIRLRFDRGVPTLVMPDGTTANAHGSLLVTRRQQAEVAQEQAEVAQEQAEVAQERVAALEAQLRALGAEPGQ